MTCADASSDIRPLDHLLAGLTYLLAVFWLLPIIVWLAVQTRASEQLLHALAVLGLCGVYLWTDKRRQAVFACRHDALSLILLGGAFLLPLLSFWMPHALLLLAAFLCLTASLTRYALGPGAARMALALLAAFSAFVALVILLPVFDWPLRYLAGAWSGKLLETLGHGIQLILVPQPELHLRLYVDGYPFLVASECNGFGVLSACLLMAILFSIYLRTGLFDGLLLVLSAVLIAMAANIFRIVTIVSLAPYVQRYMLMHEIVGILFFYAALGLLFWLIMGFRTRPQKTSRDS